MSNSNCDNTESSDCCSCCYNCHGCHACHACYSSHGCYACYSSNGCRGCKICYGCYYSFGLKNCEATYKSIFSIGLSGDKFKVFGRESTELRFHEIFDKIQSFGFYPKQTNAFELYKENGNKWSEIPVSKLTYKEWDDSWKDCPKGLITYLSSLPEFDSAIFKEITGIDFQEDSEAKKKAQELEDEATKLLAKAKDLRASL